MSKMLASPTVNFQELIVQTGRIHSASGVTTASDDILTTSAQLFLDRKDHIKKPQGYCDNAMRWYPSDIEKQECCNYIRHPSRSFPWSLLKHCSTAEHVANLCGVDTTELRKEARKIVKAQAIAKTGGVA